MAGGGLPPGCELSRAGDDRVHPSWGGLGGRGGLPGDVQTEQEGETGRAGAGSRPLGSRAAWVGTALWLG